MIRGDCPLDSLQLGKCRRYTPAVRRRRAAPALPPAPSPARRRTAPARRLCGPRPRSAGPARLRGSRNTSYAPKCGFFMSKVQCSDCALGQSCWLAALLQSGGASWRDASQATGDEVRTLKADRFGSVHRHRWRRTRRRRPSGLPAAPRPQAGAGVCPHRPPGRGTPRSCCSTARQNVVDDVSELRTHRVLACWRHAACCSG